MRLRWHQSFLLQLAWETMGALGLILLPEPSDQMKVKDETISNQFTDSEATLESPKRDLPQ